MSSIMLKENEIKNEKSNNTTLDPGKSYEVFRNNTTAVEVIVKDVLKGRTKTLDFNDMKMNRIQAEVDRLHSELDTAKKALLNTRKGFQTIVRGMSKQIESSNSRESDTQAANLALKLENEKLRMLLESKAKLLCKTKKELGAIRRVLKFVVRSICNAPEIPRNVEFSSDTEYEDFESDLKSNRGLFAAKISHKSDTFDTTASKDKESEKKE